MTVTTLPAGTTFRVVLYARVSQARGENMSIPDQLNVLRAWAEREGWHVVDELDDDVSASRHARGKVRDGWDEVMRIASTGRVEAILTWEFSRGTRDRLVYANLAEMCETSGVLLGYSGRLHDMTDDSDAFNTDMQAALAVRESRVTSKRVRRAVDARAARGKPHAQLPDGYRRVFDPDTGAVIGYEIDDERADIIREIVRRLLGGEPANAIANDLNRRGVRTGTGRIWRSGNLSKLVRRPAYAGMRVHHGEVIDGVEAVWPAIITPEQHYRLQVIYRSPERDKYRNPTHVRHLGTGLFRCGRKGCDGRMRVVHTPRGPNYSCRACHRIARRQIPVDTYVEAIVIERLSRPDALEALRGDDDPEAREQARTEVVRLRAEMADARAQFKAGRLTPVDMADFREGWQVRMAKAESAAEPPALPESVEEMAGPDAAERWDAATIATRRLVVDTLITVTILPAGVGGRPFDRDTVLIDWKADDQPVRRAAIEAAR